MNALSQRFLRPGICFLVMLLAMMVCYAGTLALPHDPALRYQSLKGTIFANVQWIYDRIHNDPAPIDVAFFGASRTAAGVYPSLLEPALAGEGRPLRVVNFAIPATGYDIRKTIADELLHNRKVKLVVIDLSEVMPRDGHPAFGELATVRELLEAPWLINRNLPSNLLRLPVRQIDLWLATLAPEANGFHKGFDPASYPGTTFDPRSLAASEDDLSILTTPEHEMLLRAQAMRRYNEMTPPLLPHSLEWAEFGVSRTYIEQIATMAKQRGVKVAFVFMPFFQGPGSPKEEQWLRQFGPVWKADFLNWDPRNYKDSGHSSADPRTKAMITSWLAQEISSTLASGSKNEN